MVDTTYLRKNLIISIALGTTLASFSCHAQVYREITFFCNEEATCTRSKVEEETTTRASTYFNSLYKLKDGENRLVNVLCYGGETMPSIASNYRFRELEKIFPSADCVGLAKNLFTTMSADREAQEVAYEKRRIALQQEEERKANEVKQQELEKIAALKSRKVKPSDLKEAAIVYSAQRGDSLASAPKIKPDGAMYYLYGKIKMAEDRPEFFAALSHPQGSEALASAERRSRQFGDNPAYFAVVVPEQLQNYYFDGAKIEGGFDLVGRYIANTKYTTVEGQEKSAPVFEAVYLVLWKQ